MYQDETSPDDYYDLEDEEYADDDPFFPELPTYDVMRTLRRPEADYGTGDPSSFFRLKPPPKARSAQTGTNHSIFNSYLVTVTGTPPGVQGSLSTPAAILSITMSVMGAMVTSLPSLCRKAGYLGGPLLLWLGVALFVWNGRVLVRALTYAKTKSTKIINRMPPLAELAGGQAFGFLIVLTSCGAMTGFVLCLTNLGTHQILRVLQSLDGFRETTPEEMGKYQQLVYSLSILGWGLHGYFVRSLSSVFHITQLAAISTVATVGLLLYTLAYVTLHRGLTTGPDVVPFGSLDFFNILEVYSALVFAFAVLVTFPGTKSEMKKPHQMGKAVTISFVIVGFLYTAIMVAGYTTFGSATQQDVLDNLHEAHPRLALALTTVFLLSLYGHVPLFLTVGLIGFEEVFPTIKENRLHRLLFVGVYTGVLLWIGLFVSNFLTLVRIIGCFFCVVNNLILPVVCYVLLSPKSSRMFWGYNLPQIRTAELLLVPVVLVLGLVIFVMGEYQAFQEIRQQSL